jgi:hypothetical protein
MTRVFLASYGEIQSRLVRDGRWFTHWDDQ